MKRHISNLESSSYFILGVVFTVLPCMLLIGTFFLIAVKSSFENALIVLPFLLFFLFLSVRSFIFYLKLVNFYTTENSFIIERFVKKEELSYSVIKSTKYYYQGLIPISIFEPRIKIIFKRKTTFGKYVFIMATRLDENKHFQAFTNIKSLIDSKIIN